LIAALRWGNGMKQEVEKGWSELAKEKDDARQALAQKDSANREALASEQQRGQALEGRLNKSQTVIVERGSVLGRTHHQLVAARQELSATRKAWEVERVQMQQDISEAKRQVVARDATIRSFLAAKAAAGQELETVRHRDAETLRKAKEESAKMKADAAQLGQLLKQERARSKTLRELVEVNKHKVMEYVDEEKHLRKDLTSADSATHNLTAQVQDALRHQQGLLRERDTLLKELQGNTSEAGSLNEQMAQLRRQLEEEKKARGKAEAVAQKAEFEKSAAQAIAKQLSSVVPQLLEQAQLAREACNADKAMRTQAQIQAQQKIQDLKHQYSSIVQNQTSQVQNMTMNRTIPNPSNALVPPMDPDAEETLVVDEDSEKLAPDEQDVVLAQEGSTQQVPDLAGDGHALDEPFPDAAVQGNADTGDGGDVIIPDPSDN